MENSELLERFLPGYRIVCRISARYLGIDLTKWATILFVIFALLKSVQYLWTSISSPVATWLTSSISIPSHERLYEDVLQWVSANLVDKHFTTSAGARSLVVASARNWDADDRSKTENDESTRFDQDLLLTPPGSRIGESLVCK
jgi:mitochondrial chaperone BCS1